MPASSEKNVVIANKIGHIKKACASRQQGRGVASRDVQHVDQTEPPTRNEYPLFTLTVLHTTPIIVPVEINNMTVNMEQHWPQLQLEESNTRLKTYSGEYLETLGNINVSVRVLWWSTSNTGNQRKGIWQKLVRKIKLDWPEIHKLQEIQWEPF